MKRTVAAAGLLCGLAVGVARAQSTPASPSAQPYDPLGASGYRINPVTQPTFTPGMLQLLELETKFAADVAARGGKAFASWFAEDGVTLANGRPPVMGRAAIAAQAQWDPKEYQLTWLADGAQMGPSNDMGYTWGHYEGVSKDQHGQSVKTSGRYITIWKKQTDGTWKVVLDASAEEPPDAGSCCSLPKP